MIIHLQEIITPVNNKLEQIVEGVPEASETISSHGGIINPTGVSFKRDGTYNRSAHTMPQDVLFYVGLTSTDQTGLSEGIGVFLGSISLGKKNDSGTEHMSVTKVRFTVPLGLPPGDKMSTPTKTKL